MNKKELIKRTNKEKDSWEWKVIEHGDNYASGRYDSMVVMLRWIKKLDEPESKIKPMIPQFVSDWIEENKYTQWWKIIAEWEKEVQTKDRRVCDWYQDCNENNFINAWVNKDYTIEENKLYARIKGHELIDTDITLDKEDNKNPEWYRNIYFVVQSNGEVIIDMKDSGLNGATHSMSEEEWNKIGINETNADFVGAD